MRAFRQSFGLLVTLMPVSIALAQSAKAPLEVFPADTVPVTASVPAVADVITVDLKAIGGQPSGQANKCSSDVGQISVLSPATGGFSFAIPLNICAGLYELSAATSITDANGKPKGVNVTSPQRICVKEKPPTVTSISPKALFKGGQQTLVFLGPSSLKAPNTSPPSDADPDYGIRFANHALPSCGRAPKGQSCFQLDVDDQKKPTSQDGQIRFSLMGDNFLSEFAGKQSVSLVRDGVESTPQELLVVNATRDTPRNYALGVTAALVLLSYLLLSGAHEKMLSSPGTTNFLLTALFLDEETQTYSLSKCQFYAWTLAGILGYVFLAVSKSAIQGSAIFPEVPSGLPTVLLFSAGTSVVATGITSARGSKGAGEVTPTLADFITTGGVVAPERLQFVVWTVVGIFTFLTIVFKSDPLTLSDLPKISDGFLNLMGISSAGYLGGKLARKPGPVIAVLSVANVTMAGENLPNQYVPPEGVVARTLPVLTVNLKGENLDPKAKIKVDGQPLRGDQFWITDGTPNPQTQFCEELNVSLDDAATYLEGSHTLTVVNSDAQAADAMFPIDPMSIDSVTVPNSPPAPVPAGAAANTPPPPDVIVKGKNFAAPTYFEWRDTAGAPLNPAAPPAAFIAILIVQSSKELNVTRPATVMPGSGHKLVLISRTRLRATSKEV
jgi:hypothetical protein